MTRAALLHVLDHATAIAPAEVRELEQLAQAFPYCQTAHLLLAKAAHDQGTMLAGQRLRRAATYAADRELLRRLIEQVAPEAVPVIEPVLVPADALFPADAGHTNETSVPSFQAFTTVVGPEITAPADPIAVVEEPVAEASAATEPSEATVEPAEVTPPVETAVLVAAAVTEAALADADQDAILLEASDAVPAAELELVEPVPQGTDEPELPAMAPPIRPPEDTGAARLEFGLGEVPASPTDPAYELPGLIDEWAAAAATLALAAPELPADQPSMNGFLALSTAAFVGDGALGYGLGGSSRLGFALQLLNSWEADDRAAAMCPAALLPPGGEFFAPDALLLEHWAAHRPPALPTAGDLINNFLRRQPRLSRPAMLPSATTGAQADLSVRSARAGTELASEGLAQILVRQGKTARAIEIYERLMVKQPEKMAYFAAQIQQLQPPVQ